MKLVYYDDQGSPATVPGIYAKLVVSEYGTNLIASAMPIVIERKLTFIGLFGLAVNEQFHYPHYFGIMPAGPTPKTDRSAGFFEIAGRQNPKPRTVALVGADAEYGQNALGAPGRTSRRMVSESSTTGATPPGDHRLHADRPRHPGVQSRSRQLRLLGA